MVVATDGAVSDLIPTSSEDTLLSLENSNPTDEQAAATNPAISDAQCGMLVNLDMPRKNSPRIPNREVFQLILPFITYVLIFNNPSVIDPIYPLIYHYYRGFSMFSNFTICFR